MASKQPRVYISYSRDSEEHVARVRALAEKLRGNGIDVRIDSDVQFPKEGWPIWMNRQIDEADFVLLVCTRGYFEKFGTGNAKGKGVIWESSLIIQSLYEKGGMENRKFVPVLLQWEDVEYIPLSLKRYQCYNAGEEAGYYSLLTFLSGKSDTTAPRVDTEESKPIEKAISKAQADFLEQASVKKRRPPRPKAKRAIAPPPKETPPSDASSTRSVYIGHQIGPPLAGHAGGVNAVSVFDNDTKAISASDDYTLRIWALRSARRIGRPLEGHTNAVCAVSVFDNGAKAISASYDWTLRIWDLHSGKQIGMPLEGHEDWVNAVSVFDNDTKAISASRDYTLMTWDLRSGERIGEPLKGHRNPVQAVAVFETSARAISASDDHGLRTWDLQSGEEIGDRLEGHTGGVRAVSVFDNDAKAISASDDRTLRIWDLKTGQQIGNPLEGHTGPVYAVSVFDNGTKAISASEDRTLRIWDLTTGTEIGSPLEGHKGPVWGVSAFDNGTKAISASEDHTLRIWEIKLGTPRISFNGTQNPLEPVSSPIFTPPDTSVKSDTPFCMGTRASSDIWTCDDTLGYMPYVRAMADPILQGSTRPPVTFAVQAPWGQGKTSIMKMIQRCLDPTAAGREDRAAGPVTRSKRATFRDLLRWLKAASEGTEKLLAEFGGAPRDTSATEAGQSSPPKRPTARAAFQVSGDGAQRQRGFIDDVDRVPTVWFNPLYYQEAEQVWAGMAHVMLRDLARQISDPVKREIFWFALHLSRIDPAAIRRDIWKAAVPRLIRYTLFSLATLAVIAILAFVEYKSQVLSTIAWFAGIGATATAVWGAAKYFWRRLGALDAKYVSYVSEPDYNSKLGFLHLVDTDLDRALTLLVGDYPIAVFIDDLDRCNPEVVKKVILAINQFLSLPNGRVFFFIGMDMDVVAGSLNQAAPGGNGDNPPWGADKTFGWRFMDKFIQVPFFLPRIKPPVAEAFLREVVGPPETRIENAPVPQAVEEDMAAIKAATSVDQVATVAKLRRSAPSDVAQQLKFQEAVSSRVTQLMSDPRGEEVRALTEMALEDLDLNPRAMKRFINLVRLLRNVQVARGLQESPEFDRRLVLRAAHLTLTWPRFMRWLQGHNSKCPIQKGMAPPFERLDEIVRASSDAESWRKAVQDAWRDQSLTYLGDEDLYHFLRKITADPPGLCDMCRRMMF